MKKCFLSIFILSFLFIGCNTNDYSVDYQKELVYDGSAVPVDSICFETYQAKESDGRYDKGGLHSKTIKWYDLNGYHSMTNSWAYSEAGVTYKVEKITRDKHSLIVARDISIEAPNTAPAVVLGRLKRRQQGEEEWIYRNYFSPDKFLEDKSFIYYTTDSKIVKRGIDSLQLVEADIFDLNNRLQTRQPGISSTAQQPFLHFYYGEGGYVDSINVKYYEHNNIQSKLLEEYTEYHKYELDSLGNQLKKYAYKNDSLMFITEYKYAYR